MTRKQTLAAIREMGLSVTFTEWGEYRVTFKRDEMPDAGKREAVAYYSPDGEDAVGGADHMRRWHDQHERKAA